MERTCKLGAHYRKRISSMQRVEKWREDDYGDTSQSEKSAIISIPEEIVAPTRLKCETKGERR
jgi:hypothetical protein